jgi:PRC-barrel domain
MKLSRALMLASIAFIAPATSHAQVAGSTLLGVSYGELRDVTFGWSAKRQILGQPVFNDDKERVGSVQDVIIGGDKTVLRHHQCRRFYRIDQTRRRSAGF